MCAVQWLMHARKGFILRPGVRARSELRRRRLRLEFAQRFDHAMPAFGPPSLAHVPAVQNQPMMRVLEKLARREFFQRDFNGSHVLAWRESGTIRNPKDMRVD